MKNKKISVFILMNIAFIVYSLSSVISKYAAGEDVLSSKWIILYGAMIFCLMIYAVMWQFVLKKIDLIVAYSSKAVVVVWGTIWGILLFREHLSLNKLLGLLIIIFGILLISKDEDCKGRD